MDHDALPAPQERRDHRFAVGLLLALTGAFVGVTSAWILWGLLSPGDFFASGTPWLVVTLGVAAISVGTMAVRVRSKFGLRALVAITICCAAFWGLARNGWWASSPPPTMTAPARAPR